jgi:uncharacterized protein YcgI (DUF1989 family)
MPDADHVDFTLERIAPMSNGRTFDFGGTLSLTGDMLELRAERDLLVAVSACSASVANGGGARPLGIGLRPVV